MRNAYPLLSMLLAACTQAPPPEPATVGAVLPSLGGPRAEAGRPGASPIAPFPDAHVCVTLSGQWPGELTACYDAADRLRGVELDVAPDRMGEAVVAVRDTYAPGISDTLVAVGGGAWVAGGVRLEVVREDTRVHVRAWTVETG